MFGDETRARMYDEARREAERSAQRELESLRRSNTGLLACARDLAGLLREALPDLKAGMMCNPSPDMVARIEAALLRYVGPAAGLDKEIRDRLQHRAAMDSAVGTTTGTPTLPRNARP